jgi:sulfur carrier protein ThiS
MDKWMPEAGEENLMEDLRVQQYAQISRGMAAEIDSDFMPQSGVTQEYYRFDQIAIVQSIIPR